MLFAYIATNKETGHTVAGLTTAGDLDAVVEILARWFPLAEYDVEVS